MKKQSEFVDPILVGDDVLFHESTTDNANFKDSSLSPRQVDSTTTSVTGGDSSYTSEEEMGWLGGIGADFRTLALTIRETAGGVVSFVHRSAITVANEISLLEDGRECDDNASLDDVEPLHLPWEIRTNDGTYEESEELKAMILQVSMRESSFMGPYSSRKSSAEDDEDGAFVLDHARVQIIRRLLKLDPQLSSMHARLSGRSDVRETTFWRNYFHACSETRSAYIRERSEQAQRRSSSDTNCSPNSLVPEDDCDNGSLENVANQPDDESFVCLSTGGKLSSPPNSVKSTGMKSIDSLVLVRPEPSCDLP
jgi:BSD domain